MCVCVYVNMHGIFKIIHIHFFMYTLYALYLYNMCVCVFCACIGLSLLLLPFLFSCKFGFCQWKSCYTPWIWVWYTYIMLYIRTYSRQIDMNSTLLTLMPCAKRIQAIEPNWLGVNDERSSYFKSFGIGWLCVD